MAASVYIASVPTSKRLADRVAFELGLRGIEVFQSPMDSRKPSDSYVTRIEQAAAFLCVIGAGSLEQAMLRQEIDRALRLQKPIMMGFHEDFHPSGISSVTLRTLLARSEYSILYESDDSFFEAMIEKVKLWIDHVKVEAPASPVTHGGQPIPQRTSTGHIFLSYSRCDLTFVKRLYMDLNKAGFRVWIDQEGLEPGTPGWERAIADALSNAACVVAVMSPDAEQSRWVGCELAKAEATKRRIFPILSRGDEGSAIPLRLMCHQWVDARADYAVGLGYLVESLRRYLAARV